VRKKYRIGVIGAGARGESFARQLFAGTESAELFAVCDKDAVRLGEFMVFCGMKGVRTFTDPVAFFAAPEMDGVVITTPDFTHRDVAIQAMRAGKHIYLEKPIAPTTAQCREIIHCQKETGMIAFVGFNMRAMKLYERAKELLCGNPLGQIVHIEGLEQLSKEHSASFMRRFHRRRANTGGILNHKCSHDLDIMQWFIGHEHKLVKVGSLGGTNVFISQKAPAKYCSECPSATYAACPYKDVPGFVFPVRNSDRPLHHPDRITYGGDLCVYNEDKDIFDNQTVIMEWDHGVRGNFNLQLFQAYGRRETRIWGEKGFMQLIPEEQKIRLIRSSDGECTETVVVSEKGGHGGSDPKMLNRFVQALETGNPGDSSLAEGMAATLLAEKAEQSVLTGQFMSVDTAEYNA
jgi:predicted dehydrogenase